MKYIAAFICVHNSCRSQMAEAWTRHLGNEIITAYSAGTEEYPEVKPLAVEVMRESGVDIGNYKPKLIKDIPEKVDILITMGCNVICPNIPNKHSEDWGITDPSGGPMEKYREARDIIRERVMELIEWIRSGDLELML